MRPFPLVLTTLALAAATAAPARQHQSTLGEAGSIASQPGRDVGLIKRKIPPVLKRAAAAPYGPTGTGDCAAIAKQIADLSAAIGPDYGAATAPKGSRVGKAAREGGTAAIDSIIPFRGLVREVSGAAAADRRLAAATSAGFARRGFLRGLASARRCPTR